VAQTNLAVVPAEQNQPDLDQHQKLLRWIKAVNIAEELDDTQLQAMGDRCVREYNIDVTSCADWKQKTEKAMELAMQVAKEKQFPWPKASNVIFPLMTTASIQFAARAYPAIVQNRSVVKGIVIGSDDGKPQIDPRTGQPVMGPNGAPVWAIPPGAKQNMADSIGEHMSWQLLDEQPEWESETDTLLHVLPIVGCVFRKSYFDPGKGRNCSLMCSAMHLVINYKAKSTELAPRLSEEIQYYPHEIEEQFRAELWRRPVTPFGLPDGAADDMDAPHEFIEQHRYWDLDGDDYAEPYIVTVHKRSRQVVRVVARYDEEGVKFNARSHAVQKIDPIHYYTKYDFLPNPDGGIYGIGFGQLLRPINEAVNTTLNQLIDAGTLQNTGGGFIGKGLSMNAGSIKFMMGEYKVVNVSGNDLRANLLPLPFAGPSPVLFNLLGMLVEAGKEIASIKDILTGDAGKQNANTPATTTLALIEQGLKVYTSIYKRVHRALKSELAKLYRLNRIYGDETSEYKVGDTWKQVTKQDYVNGSGVEPISDPTMVSDMQRLGRAQFLMQFANDPFFKGAEVRKVILKAASMENIIDRVLNEQPPTNPAIAIKGMELEIKDADSKASQNLRKAQEVQAYATAINQLAMADKTVGDQHLGWLDGHLRVWEAQFDAATSPTPEGQSAPAGGGPPPPQLPHPVGLPQPSEGATDQSTVNPHNPAAALGPISRQ
jgi:chaperonin GroES